MKKREGTTFLLFTALLLALVAGCGEPQATPKTYSQQKALGATAQGDGAPGGLKGSPSQEHLPGQLLVKFKPGTSAMERTEALASVAASRMRKFKLIDTELIRLPQGMSVKEGLELFRSMPQVEYAEPNYRRHALETFPDDPEFGQLWGLHNEGQTGGTPDADIDAPEAWDIQTGSGSVVAVVDSGVDYNHPDLATNMWQNTGELDCTDGLDDDGNGYIDDCRGWDFVHDDNDPMDPNGHGTHVAGTIGAEGNNGQYVVGVNWTVKIMPLRFLDASGSGSVADAVEAIQYAQMMGAKVINASYGSTTFSQTEKDAIAAFGGLFVAAAGNSAQDNDSSPHYPASYDLDNIVAVAATDHDDHLASFSNYGATSVDVAAPGVDILSTIPDRKTIWSDNFDDGDASDWTSGGTNNTWDLTSSVSYSPPWSLTDSPGDNYQSNTNAWINSPAFSLSGEKDCKLSYQMRLETELDQDALYIEASTDGSTWDVLQGWTGSTGGAFWPFAADLGAYDGQGSVQVRFRLQSDGSNNFDGAYIDDVEVSCADTTYDGSELGSFQGTSMAAPHVAGLAGLLWAQEPTLSTAQVKDLILATVDVLSSLSGKLLTGGRVNAHSALSALVSPPAAPSGLSAQAVSESRIDLTWTDNSAGEEGFKVERSETSGGPYTLVATLGTNITSYSDTGLSASTTYYYRVVAFNLEGESPSEEASATTQSAPEGDGGGGGCFIATAAYGSPLANEVLLLRHFRDQVLLKSAPGRAFVRAYYRCSPPVAELIARHEALRALVRLALWPLVWLIKHPLLALGLVGLLGMKVVKSLR